MSRCFPFPPPGYAKKTRTDEVDLLKKEKQREKRHKKDKKDKKEKRESKEKKDKEGRDGKHKEKDKKEKHREKKKDKEKGKDKDKDKGRDRDRDKDKSKTSNTADDKGLPVQVGGPDTSKLQKEVKHDKKIIFVDNKLTKQYTGNNGEKARENNHVAEENKDAKFLLELDKRIKDDNGGFGNQSVHKFTNADHRKDEGTLRLAAKGSDTWFDGGEKLKDKGFGAKKIDGKGIQTEVRLIGNAAVQNHAGNFHPRADGMPKLLGKYFDKNLEATVEGNNEGNEKPKEKKDEGKEKVKEKKVEGKEKVKEKKDDKRGIKRKNKEEKKGHGKDKDRDKEKKAEKTKQHTELKTTEQNKLKGSNNVGPIDSNYLPRVSKNNNENVVSEENFKKRKDIEPNGVLHANDNWPSKLPRSSSSSHPFTENGRILEPCQISIPNASVRPEVTTSSVKVENRERKINGVIEAQPFVAVSSKKTHIATMSVDSLIEASAKPSHPDMKYLSGVYSVPKVEWSDFDDQEWLFGSNISQERNPVVKSLEVGETPQVWAETVHIESADVFALPYVIPY